MPAAVQPCECYLFCGPWPLYDVMAHSMFRKLLSQSSGDADVRRVASSLSALHIRLLRCCPTHAGVWSLIMCLGFKSVIKTTKYMWWDYETHLWEQAAWFCKRQFQRRWLHLNRSTAGYLIPDITVDVNAWCKSESPVTLSVKNFNHGCDFIEWNAICSTINLHRSGDSVCWLRHAGRSLSENEHGHVNEWIHCWFQAVSFPHCVKKPKLLLIHRHWAI